MKNILTNDFASELFDLSEDSIYNILEEFNENQNIDKTLSHDYIIGHIWGENGQDPNGLRVFMAGIRKKINKDPRSSKILRTDVGLGYRMNSVD